MEPMGQEQNCLLLERIPSFQAVFQEEALAVNRL
jgi:hypothetical protein